MKKGMQFIVLCLLIDIFLPLCGMKLKLPSDWTPQETEEKSRYMPELIPQGILLFLDDTEKGGTGAIATALSTALAQSAGPIIASSVALFNALSLYKKSQAYTVESLSKMIFSGSPLSGDMYVFLLYKNTGFNITKWVIKKVSSELYLLIPQMYLSALQVDTALVTAYTPTAGVSVTEKKLGIKVNHMETIGNVDHIVPAQGYQFADYFEASKIFCTHSDYSGAEFQPLWSIYVAGHGAIGFSISALRVEKFKAFLQFLETSINTRLLTYLSCYSAGVTAEKIYKDNSTLLERSYHFAIMTQALTDAPVSMGYGVEMIGNVVNAVPHVRYDLFLKEVARTSEAMDYEIMASHIFDIHSGSSWANTPQIKLPGTEWFSVLASRKEAVSIGSILARARDADKPLDVLTFFKTDPQALLLYAKEIPFELVINSINMQAIISMVPGDAVHTIKKISSNTKDFGAILDWFMTIRGMAVKKIFFIERIGEYKNIVIYMDGQNSPRAYFVDQANKVYAKFPQQKQFIPASGDDYQNVLTVMRQSQKAQGTKPFETTITTQEIEKIKYAIEVKPEGKKVELLEVEPSYTVKKKEIVAKPTKKVEQPSQQKKRVEQKGKVREQSFGQKKITFTPKGDKKEKVTFISKDDKKNNLKKGLAEYEASPSQSTVLEQIIGQLARDVKSGKVRIESLDPALVNEYWDVYQEVSGKH